MSQKSGLVSYMQEFVIMEILHHENEIPYDKNIGSL